MTYILYYDFKNTSGNHAGMAYLARFLGNKNTDTKLIKHIPQEGRGGKYLGLLYAFYILIVLLIRLRKGDKVFFMEYMSGVVAYQHLIARGLRFLGRKNNLVGLIHLSGDHLLEFYKTPGNILDELKPLNAVVVLGSSLKRSLENFGYKGRIICTFHYVDDSYYKPSGTKIENEELSVIFMGSLKRNIEDLKQIIQQSDKKIQFHVCAGKSVADWGIEALPNVTKYGYLKEDELLKVMQKCNVNLSVMDDTIGSNAITTALAVGLVQVTSDVGSIRDYCNEDNGFFCNSIADYLNALNSLNSDRRLLETMQLSALNRGKQFSMDHFSDEFLTFL